MLDCPKNGFNIIKKISFTYVAIDVFHYGHLKLLQQAKEYSEYHICGLLTDEVCIQWNGNIIMTYHERFPILNSLVCVDEIIKQSSIDPTENLKLIHHRYPNAEIILFEGHQEWKNMPGSNFVRSINGRIIKPEFYPRLTRSFIKDELSKSNNKSEFDIESYLIGNISYFSINNATKAKVLESLEPLLTLSKIEELFVFTSSNWERFSSNIIMEIKNKFSGEIIVRSSSSLEDSLKYSNAGLFHSELNVDSNCVESIKSAINKVIDSYINKGDTEKNQQILIQSQTKDIKISGVLLTRDIEKKAPYYVINYDLGKRTDTVTSGLVNNNIRIIKNINNKRLPKPWKNLIKAVNEIEDLLDDLALDIEFAIKNNNEIVIFQVRPLAAVNRFIDCPDNKVYGLLREIMSKYKDLSKASVFNKSYTLSDMSFWNPAEIIGSRADNLSYSLYHYILLNEEWNKGLLPLGYKDVSRSIMVRILNKPYIELETAFKALMPKEVDEETEKLLLKYYIDEIRKNPELHDKIEFKVSLNCFLPTTDISLKKIKKILGKDSYNGFRNSLISQTQNIFNSFDKIKNNDLKALDKLNKKRIVKIDRYNSSNLHHRISMIIDLLDDVKELGSSQFSRMARLAFIGNQYLKSLITCGIVQKEEIDSFLYSIETVASRLNDDFQKVSNNEISIKGFNKVYGHLRPGTYNINHLPYNKEPRYLNIKTENFIKQKINKYDEKKLNTKHIEKKIDKYLNQFEIKISARNLLDYIEKTTQLREEFKFEFTKNLSLAIEWLAEVGQEIGFCREKLSFLTVESLKGISKSTTLFEIRELWSAQIEGQILKENISNYINLPSIIFDKIDLECVILRSSSPNFITSKKITSELINLEDLGSNEFDQINNKIVLIEKADPGFDWIFSKNISGLVTMYGGVGSHMAIRCAEFGIPAAIGCGQVLYKQLKDSRLINLDCNNKLITNL